MQSVFSFWLDSLKTFQYVFFFNNIFPFPFQYDSNLQSHPKICITSFLLVDSTFSVTSPIFTWEIKLLVCILSATKDCMKLFKYEE